MLRGMFILAAASMLCISGYGQKTVIEKDGRVISIHKERRNKQVHITYHENGKKASKIKIKPEWVVEKEWYPNGQKKKHVVYSQVSFTAEYKKYVVWDENGNKIENVARPEEAVMIADYTELRAEKGEEIEEERASDKQPITETRETENEEKKKEETIVFHTDNQKETSPEPRKKNRKKIKDNEPERRVRPEQKNNALIEFEVPEKTIQLERNSTLTEDVQPMDVEAEMKALEASGDFILPVDDVQPILEFAESLDEPVDPSADQKPERLEMTFEHYDLAMNDGEGYAEIEEGILTDTPPVQATKVEAEHVDEPVAQKSEAEEKEAEPEIRVFLTRKEKALLEPIEQLSIEANSTNALQASLDELGTREVNGVYRTDGSDYQTRLAEADMAFDDGDLDLAGELYAEAAKTNPSAVYPQDKLRQVQMINWEDKGSVVVLEKQVYSKDNPVPIDAPIPEGLTYRVQLLAVSGDIPYDALPRVAPIAGMTVRGSMKRYMAGEFATFNQAEDALMTVRRNGTSEAFIIAFHDGEYISVKEAIKIEGARDKKEEEGRLLTSF